MEREVLFVLSVSRHCPDNLIRTKTTRHQTAALSDCLYPVGRIPPVSTTVEWLQQCSDSKKRSYSAHLWILMITSMTFVATILSLNNFWIYHLKDNHYSNEYFSSFVLIQWLQKTSNSTGSGKKKIIKDSFMWNFILFYGTTEIPSTKLGTNRILWG